MKAPELTFKDIDKIIELLKRGKVGVMPTDTIYGIVGSALNPNTVEEIYALRKRDSSKPMIILISSLDDLLDFDIVLTSKQKDFLNKIWPNPVSVILPCPHQRFSYLHRGKKSLAFRLPKNTKLLQILKKVGPLVAPSANFANEKPAQNLEEAKKYFGDKVAMYIDGQKLKSKPSTIIRLYEDGKQIVLRQGGFKTS
ncbi:L-threonylcarbamoyladenylate synthase [Patescibacteria group bacterium]|nr:L-threonylcarbamoyladenylate synthase [Patescibacteria group bacterium]